MTLGKKYSFISKKIISVFFALTDEKHYFHIYKEKFALF